MSSEDAPPTVVELVVATGESGARLDHFVARHAGLSHSAARRLLDDNGARINGARAVKGTRVRAGDRVTLTLAGLRGDVLSDGDVDRALTEAVSATPIPEPDAPLEVLFCDAHVVVVNKRAGVPSHPLRRGERGTVAGALVARFPECASASADPREAGLAHRLDVDTSGVLVAARSRADWDALRHAFSGGGALKEYLALVAGVIAEPGNVELALAHVPGDARRVMAVADGVEAVRLDARPARSRYVPLASDGEMTLVQVTTTTGRMHQVRVHMAALGHPLVGDVLYGGPPELPGAPGHFLHAARLTILALDLRAPLPPDRADVLARRGLLPAKHSHVKT